MSQINDELEILKNGHYDNARQFVEHLVNILTRQSAAIGANNTIPSQPDDHFWGYVFNYVAKEVDLELDAMYAVTYRKNQLTLLFNPKYISKNYDVITMLEGLRHEGYHLLFNHLEVHKNLDNRLSNLAGDCEINQKLKNPADNWISLPYIEMLAEQKLPAHAGSITYYEALSNSDNPQLKELLEQMSHGQPGAGQPGAGQPGAGNGQVDPHQCSSKHWGDAQVGTNDNYIPANVTVEAVMKQALNEAKQRGTVSAGIEEAVANINKPAQVSWQQEIRKKMGRQVTGRRPSPNRLYRRDPYALHKKGQLSDAVMPIVFAFDVSGSVSREEMEIFFNEIVQMVKKTHHPVTQIQFDSDVVFTQTIDGTTAKKLEIGRMGCGGTTFQSVFDYMSDNKFPRETQVFIFTDGGGESTINTRGYNDYTWLLTDNNPLSVRDNRKKIINIKSN